MEGFLNGAEERDWLLVMSSGIESMVLSAGFPESEE